jgi:hypothetical protein
VLKISKPLGAQKVNDYYKFEHTAADQGYYAEGKQLVGEWHGRLAAEFGLIGAVDEQHYERLTLGQDPWTGEQLIKHRMHGPAWLHDAETWRMQVQAILAEAALRGLDYAVPTPPLEAETYAGRLVAGALVELEKTALAARTSEDLYARVDAHHRVIEMLADVPERERLRVAAALRVCFGFPAPDLPKEAGHREHVAAWDWTLAPHKSYSVTALVGRDRGLVEDHKKAVRTALDAGEKYTQARLRDVAPMTSANWCAALFLHDSARPVGDEPPNPHLHTHAVVFNMTNAGDKIRSVQSREWYRIQSYVAAVYQAQMAYYARARGYELEHGRNYSTAIKGYTEGYLKAVSARTEGCGSWS